MAAESDEAKDGKEAGERRRGGDRRKSPPVTIDLTAERVAADKAEPKPEAPASAPASATPPPEPAAPPSESSGRTKSEPPRPTRPPGASPIGSDDSWTRLALAGAAGGILALVVLLALQGIGLLPSPGRSAALQAADQAKAASDAVAGFDRRLSALEMVADGLPAKSAFDGLTQRVAQLETAQGDLAGKSDLTALSDQLTALSAKVDAGATHDDLAALAARVAALEAGGGSAAGSDGGASSAEVTALSGRIDAATASIKTLSDRVAALESKSNTGTDSAALAGRAVAVVALRRAADGSAPFTTDLDLAAALGIAPDDIAALKPLAAKGAPTRATLAAEFSAVGDRIIGATTQSDPNAGFFDRLKAGLGGLVTVRPAGPVTGNDPPAIVSRMRAAVDGGDFEAALKEREALPEAGKQASADWAASAQDRADIDALIEKIAATVKPGAGPT